MDGIQDRGETIAGLDNLLLDELGLVLFIAWRQCDRNLLQAMVVPVELPGAEDETLIRRLSFPDALYRPLINPLLIRAVAVPGLLMALCQKILSDFLIRPAFGHGVHQTIIPQGV